MTANWLDSVPYRFWDATWRSVLDAHPPQATEPLRRWMEGDDGSLILRGPVGVGKTWTAVAAGFELAGPDAGFEVRFTTAADMLRALRPAGAGIETFVDPDYLVIDDLGAERLTESWGIPQLLAVVDARWRERRASIVTTNLAGGDLAANIGERSYDRIRDGAVAVRLSGPSRRTVVSLHIREAERPHGGGPAPPDPMGRRPLRAHAPGSVRGDVGSDLQTARGGLGAENRTVPMVSALALTNG